MSHGSNFTTPDRPDDRADENGSDEDAGSSLFNGPMTVAPNPVRERLTVHLPRRGYRTATLLDANGREVLRRDLDPELYGFFWSVAALPAGTYFLSVYADALPTLTKTVVVTR